MLTLDAAMLTTNENDVLGDLLSIEEVKQKDIDSMKSPNEPLSSWQRRRLFLEVHWDNFTMREISVLSNAFINVLTLGCEYSPSMMLKLNAMAMPVAMAAERKKGGNPSAISHYWLHEKLQKKVYRLQKCFHLGKRTVKEVVPSTSTQGSSDEDLVSVTNKDNKNLTNVKRAAQSQSCGSSYSGDTAVQGNYGNRERKGDAAQHKINYTEKNISSDDIVPVIKSSEVHVGKSSKVENTRCDAVSELSEVYVGKSGKHGRQKEVSLHGNKSRKREKNYGKYEEHAGKLKVQAHSIMKTKETCSEKPVNTETKFLKKLPTVQKGDNSCSKMDGLRGGQRSVEKSRETESDRNLGDTGKFKAMYVGGYGGYRHSVDYTKLLRKVRAKREEQKSKAIKDLRLAKQQLKRLGQCTDKMTGSHNPVTPCLQSDRREDSLQQLVRDMHSDTQLGVFTYSDRRLKVEKQGTTYEETVDTRPKDRVTTSREEDLPKGSRSPIYVTSCVRDLKVFMDIKKKMGSGEGDKSKISENPNSEPRNYEFISKGHCAQCQGHGPKNEDNVHNSPIKKMQTAIGKVSKVPCKLRSPTQHIEVTVKSRHDPDSDLLEACHGKATLQTDKGKRDPDSDLLEACHGKTSLKTDKGKRYPDGDHQEACHGKTLLKTDKGKRDPDGDHQEACHGKTLPKTDKSRRDPDSEARLSNGSMAVTGIIQDQLNSSDKKIVDSAKSKILLSAEDQIQETEHKGTDVRHRGRRRHYTKQNTCPELLASKPVDGKAENTYMFIPTQVYRARSKKLAPLRSS